MSMDSDKLIEGIKKHDGYGDGFLLGLYEYIKGKLNSEGNYNNEYNGETIMTLRDKVNAQESRMIELETFKNKFESSELWKVLTRLTKENGK